MSEGRVRGELRAAPEVSGDISEEPDWRGERSRKSASDKDAEVEEEEADDDRAERDEERVSD